MKEQNTHIIQIIKKPSIFIQLNEYKNLFKSLFLILNTEKKLLQRTSDLDHSRHYKLKTEVETTEETLETKHILKRSSANERSPQVQQLNNYKSRGGISSDLHTNKSSQDPTHQ